MIFTEIKKVLLSLYSRKVENEAIVSYDFKLIDFKSVLVRLSFSPLANWPLFLLAFFLYVNPYRYQLQLLGQFPTAVAFLYSPQWATGFSIGMVLSYFIGFINIPIALVLYFVSQGEIHTILGSSILAGLFSGRILKYFKLAVSLKGKIKKIVLYYSLMQLCSLILALFINISVHQYLTAYGFFSRTMFAYRFEFIVISLFIYYLTQFILNSVWGHFYSKKQDEPTKIFLFYSTVWVLKNFLISKKLKFSLRQQAEVKLAELSVLLADPNIVYIPKSILETARTEKEYLDTAKERLT